MSTTAPAAALKARRQLLVSAGQRVRRQPGKPGKPVRFPTAVRLRYFRELRSIVNDINEAVRRVVFPELPWLVQSVAFIRGDDARYDAPSDDIRRLIDALRVAMTSLRLTQRVEQAGYQAARDVSEWNKKEVNGQFQALIGLDLIRSEPYLDAQFRAFIEENVSLIKSITIDKHGDVENLLYRSIRTGARVETIKQEIEDNFDVTRGRAALIARDQVGKFNGELTQLRHQSVGCEEYIWDTSQDERVRSSHRILHGTRQHWAKPPVVSVNRRGVVRRAHPGQDYQCRCNALPILPDDLLDIFE